MTDLETDDAVKRLREGAIRELRNLLADAESVLAAGGDRMTVVSTPQALRVLRLRGEVLCEHPDGRRAYSLKARRVKARCKELIEGLTHG